MINAKAFVSRRPFMNFDHFSPKTLLALLLVYFVWGSTYLAIGVAVKTLPPYMLTGTRFFIAGGTIFTLMRLRGAPMPSLRQWRNAFLIGALMMGGGVGGVAFAEQWIASALAALVGATIPLWAALFASFWERKPNRLEIASMFMGVIGVGILNLGDELWVHSAGAMVILFSPILWALGTILSRHLSLPGGLMNSGIIMIGGSFTLMVLSLLIGERIPKTTTAESVAAALYLTVFGSIITFSAYSYLVQKVQHTVATSYAYVNPVVAGVLGWLILDEALSPLTLLAAAFIVGAVILITTQRTERDPKSVVKPRETA